MSDFDRFHEDASTRQTSATAIGQPHAASPPPVPIPAHDRQLRNWRQTHRGGTREDRTLREVEVRLPPRIAELEPVVPPFLGAAMDTSLREIARLDEAHGEHLAALSTLLLRAESVASSKIEQVDASSTTTRVRCMA